MSGTRGGLGRIVAMGIALALALLLLVAGEATGGQVRSRPVRLVRRRRRRLGRHHRRRQVPPGRLVRAARRRRPLRRRPHEEPHPRRPGHRLRHPLRPLALGGAGRHRHLPGARHLVARPPRRHGAADRRRHLERRLRRLRRRRRHRHDPARVRRRLLAGAARARGPPALRQGREQVVQPRPGLLVGDPGADDHRPGRPGAGGGDRRRHHRRRLAARRAERQLLGRRHRRRHPLRRNAARRRPRRPHRVPLREGPDRRCLEGDPDAALPTSASPAAPRSTPPASATVRHSIHHCVIDFAGNVGCTADQTVAIDNNPPAHPRNLALAGGEGWRRVDDFDFSWADPDQGPASPIGGAFWRITGPAGYDTGVKFAPGRDLAALNDVSVPRAGRLLAAALAARRSRQRRPVLGARGAAALRRRRRPGVAFEVRLPTPDAAGAGAARTSATLTRGRPAGRSSTGASTPSSGSSCRPR